jgi:hypothetical protein
MNKDYFQRSFVLELLVLRFMPVGVTKYFDGVVECVLFADLLTCLYLSKLSQEISLAVLLGA